MRRSTHLWAERIAFAPALLLFWGVALWRLDVPSFWYDELFNVNLVLGKDFSEMLVVLRTQQPYPPLYYLLLRAWAVLSGAQPYAPGLEPRSGLEFLLRFPSVVAGLLVLVLLVPLGRRLRVPCAPLMPWWLVFHPVMLWYARDARMYALWVALTGAALYSLLSKRRWLWWFSATGALLTHYFAVFPLAGAAMVALLNDGVSTNRNDRVWKRWGAHIIAVGAPFLCFVMWILVALPVTSGFQSFGTASPPNFAAFLDLAGPDLLTARVFLEPLGPTLDARWGYGLLIAALVGLSTTAWKAPRQGSIVLGAVLLGAVTTFVAWQLRPVQHVRYLVWMLPFLALGLGALAGARDGQRRTQASWVLGAALVPVILWNAQHSWAFLVADRTIWYPDFRDTVRLLNERALPGDVGIAVAAHGLEIFTAYRTPVAFVPGPTVGERMKPSGAANLIDEPRGRVWTLLYQDEVVDPGQILIGTLESAGGYRVEMGYSRELRLYAYEVKPPVTSLRPQHGLDATFGDGVLLRGWSVHREERLVGVYLFWELLAPPTQSLLGAVHLARDSVSAPAVQRDKPVLNEYWTLPDLPVGETLPDRYEMVIPMDLPAGTYQLYALLYTPGSGQRLVLATGEDRLYLGDFIWP